MEFEQLEIGKKTITNAISRQEVTNYYDLLHPNVLLVSHFRYPPMPTTISDTIPVLDHVLRRENKSLPRLTRGRNPWKAPEHLQATPANKVLSASASPMTPAMGTPCLATVPGVSRGTPPLTHAKTAQVQAVADRDRRLSKSTKPAIVTGAPAAGHGRREEPNKKLLQPVHPGPYEVDIVEGPLLTTARFYMILQWMNQGSSIAETLFEMEARKVALQESDVLPQPVAPKTEAEWYSQLGRQHTERNQRLSRLTVTYGRDLLLFRDECYFEDGLIVTVHRFMLTQKEMLDLSSLVEYHQQAQIQRRIEAMKIEREKFYAAEKKRINTSHSAAEPLLDFTFCDVSEPISLLSVEPVSGKRHVFRGMRQSNPSPLAHAGYINPQNDPHRHAKEHRIMVKARNKAGDEEVYEFVDNSRPRYDFLYDPKSHAESALQTLADKMKSMFSTSSVRISACGMRSTENLVPVLCRLVANAILTIRSLDLSDNEISTLPDLSLLPIQRLLLHKNKISEWSQVEDRVCVLPLLQVLTLHGNPISENNEQYRQEVLARLLRHPRRAVRMRQLDFVTLTAQDFNIAGAFEMFATGNTSVLEKARRFSVSDIKKKKQTSLCGGGALYR
uniref:Leucine-rich repeat-containing protein 51 n=1 Tax=Trypanosoma congolense (strain IL3000) TaxID=1068625 RepID=G0URB0_TRYCI|nr:unnamed protein product [Trypanosoma congolense IL3000]